VDTRPDEPPPKPLGVRPARLGEASSEGAGVGTGLGMQNPDGRAIHPANLAAPPKEANRMGPSVRAHVGLGANVGDAEATLADAVRALAELPRVALRGVSDLYRTKPVGVTEQPDFHNAVVALDVPAGADAATGATDLLVRLKELERRFGRRRGRRWGPRELDLDLLTFGDARLSIERPLSAAPLSADLDPAAATRLLEVPHPSMRDRLFVLAPLSDLAPGLVPPGWQETVDGARERVASTEARDAVLAVGRWDPTTRRWRHEGPETRAGAEIPDST
jgi:2-amino-4-hydroxy-6-hydroxymethyldihydropteridine diphosphokinase